MLSAYFKTCAGNLKLFLNISSIVFPCAGQKIIFLMFLDRFGFLLLFQSVAIISNYMILVNGLFYIKLGQYCF